VTLYPSTKGLPVQLAVAEQQFMDPAKFHSFDSSNACKSRTIISF
jgi:hypothetical protein